MYWFRKTRTECRILLDSRRDVLQNFERLEDKSDLSTSPMPGACCLVLRDESIRYGLLLAGGHGLFHF